MYDQSSECRINALPWWHQSIVPVGKAVRSRRGSHNLSFCGKIRAAQFKQQPERLPCRRQLADVITCARKTRPFGKAEICIEEGIGVIFDDDDEIVDESGDNESQCQKVQVHWVGFGQVLQYIFVALNTTQCVSKCTVRTGMMYPSLGISCAKLQIVRCRSQSPPELCKPVSFPDRQQEQQQQQQQQQEQQQQQQEQQ